MPKLLRNVLKILGGKMPQIPPPGYAPDLAPHKNFGPVVPLLRDNNDNCERSLKQCVFDEMLRVNQNVCRLLVRKNSSSTKKQYA